MTESSIALIEETSSWNLSMHPEAVSFSDRGLLASISSDSRRFTASSSSSHRHSADSVLDKANSSLEDRSSTESLAAVSSSLTVSRASL